MAGAPLLARSWQYFRDKPQVAAAVAALALLTGTVVAFTSGDSEASGPNQAQPADSPSADVPPTAPTTGPSSISSADSAPMAMTLPDKGGRPPGGGAGGAGPAWGFASTRGAAFDGPIGAEVELDHQRQWGSWRRDGDRWASMVRTGTGRYSVKLPGLAGKAGAAHAELGAGSGGAQAGSCQVGGTHDTGGDLTVDVVCFDGTGQPRNMPFVAAFSGANSGVTVRYRGGSASGNTTVNRLGPGRYSVTLPGNGYAKITPVGDSARWCRVTETPGPTKVTVACVTPGGAAADGDWNLSYSQGSGVQHDPGTPGAYLVTGGGSWSSTGESPQVTHTGPGAYRIEYEAVGHSPDAVLVNAVSGEARYCRNQNWNSTEKPGQVRIEVLCFDGAGRPADSGLAIGYLRAP
ncbi:hypothetical protein D5S17_06945 [Pseudonocardiaceae bacterium YIM PH 21723]|nr:hypothetical protein D5S17_06945 [Pseudonocardiaceae bacterium YIM PH 21723]